LTDHLRYWASLREFPTTGRSREEREVEPLFLIATSGKIQERLYPRGFRESKPSWMLLVLLLGGQRLETSGIAVLDSPFCDENGRERRISKKAPKIAEEFERVSLRRKT